LDVNASLGRVDGAGVGSRRLHPHPSLDAREDLVRIDDGPVAAWL
jgi:hypothetical protein